MTDTGVNVPPPEEQAPSGFADIMNMPLPGGGVVMPERDPIGGFSASPGDRVVRNMSTGLMGPTAETYFAGDEFAMLQRMTTEDRVRLQEQLMAVGLSSNPIFGEIDDDTAQGFRSVLAMANRRGERWQSTLGRIATEEPLRQETQEFQPQPYLAPDYAEVSQAVKQTFRDRLGRDPDDYELQQLASELQGFSSLEYEREQELRQMAFEAEQEPGIQQPGQVEAVDPMARFQQRFDELYSGEMDIIEAKEEARGQRESVQGAVDLASQAARGNY